MTNDEVELLMPECNHNYTTHKWGEMYFTATCTTCAMYKTTLIEDITDSQLAYMANDYLSAFIEG